MWKIWILLDKLWFVLRLFNMTYICLVLPFLIHFLLQHSQDKLDQPPLSPSSFLAPPSPEHHLRPSATPTIPKIYFSSYSLETNTVVKSKLRFYGCKWEKLGWQPRSTAVFVVGKFSGEIFHLQLHFPNLLFILVPFLQLNFWIY